MDFKNCPERGNPSYKTSAATMVIIKVSRRNSHCELQTTVDIRQAFTLCLGLQGFFYFFPYSEVVYDLHL